MTHVADPAAELREIRARLYGKGAADTFLSVADAETVDRLTWGRFWSLVEGYASAIALKTRPDDFILIMSRTRTDAIAFFFAAIRAGRLVSFFPPPNRVQDEAFYRNQQSASIGKIAPDHIVTFDETSAAMVREIGFDHALRVFEPPQPGDWRSATGSCGTKICFQVGGDDARKMADERGRLYGICACIVEEVMSHDCGVSKLRLYDTVRMFPFSCRPDRGPLMEPPP